MKSLLICALALFLTPLAHASDQDAEAQAVENEQLVIDASADEGAAKDAQELAKHAEEEAREMKKKAVQEERQARRAEVTAKTELQKAEAKHQVAQEKIKKWKVEHVLWQKKRMKFEEQTAKAKADEQAMQDEMEAAKKAVAEAHEAAEQARRARDEAERIKAEAERDMKRLKNELKQAQAEETRAKQPLETASAHEAEPARQGQASAQGSSPEPVAQAVQAPAKVARRPSGNLVTLPRDCNLREQASAGSNSQGPVLKGAKLQVRAAGEKWYKVSTDDGKSGFMAAFCFK